MPEDNGREWEKVLELLLGQKITLSIHEVKMEGADTEENDNPQKEKLIRPRFMEK